MNKAILDGDLVVGTLSGDVAGPTIPNSLAGFPLDRLRFLGGRLVDAATITTFYVDERGFKHVDTGGDGRQALACAWNDVLVREGETWRVQNDADRLSLAKNRAKLRVDALAETIRLSVITPGAGQLATYLAQEAEARLLIANPETSTPTPYLAALVGVIAPTIGEVAQVVAAMSDQWNTINAAVNAARLIGKATIDGASDLAGVAAAEAAIVWPTVGA